MTYEREDTYAYPLSAIEARQKRGREMAAEIASLKAVNADLLTALETLHEASKKHEKAHLWNSHWRAMWFAADVAITRAKKGAQE